MIRKRRNAYLGSPAVCPGHSAIGTQFGRQRLPLPQCVSGRERGGLGKVLVSRDSVRDLSISIVDNVIMLGPAGSLRVDMAKPVNSVEAE